MAIASVQQAAFADHNIQYQFRTENNGGQVMPMLGRLDLGILDGAPAIKERPPLSFEDGGIQQANAYLYGNSLPFLIDYIALQKKTKSVFHIVEIIA